VVSWLQATRIRCAIGVLEMRDPARSALARGGMRRATRAFMTTTIGHLVSQLFETYDGELHDEELAAVATQVRLTELLERTGARNGAPAYATRCRSRKTLASPP
jgi:hypothetical protein